jgi:hypothetical protein
MALLPRGACYNLPSRETLIGVGAATNPRAVISMICIYVIIAIFMMSAQWNATSRQTPAHVDNNYTPISSTASPEVLPPNSAQ